MIASRDLAQQFAFKNHLFLTLTVLATTALISTDGSAFSLILFLSCIAWRLWIELVSLKIPSRWLTGITSLVLIFLTYKEHGTLIGTDVTVTLLVGLTGLKILECSAERDKFFLYLLCWATIGFKFLFQVDLWILIPSSVLTMMVFYLMLRDQSSIPSKRVILLHALTAIPVGLVLFIIFPRNQYPINAGFGSTITSADSAVTGFSDELMPGSIASLTKIQETAFRVQFESDYHPDMINLYWRGDTLAEAQGLYWKKRTNPQSRDRQSDRANSAEPNISYTVLLEPHGKNWIFTLPGTISVNSKEMTLVQNRSSNFSSVGPIYRNISYRSMSNSDIKYEPSLETDYIDQPTLSPAVKELIAPIEKLKTRKQKIQALLNIFRSGNFVYSLNPGKMETLDDFLISKKEGFCEHFSAAFASLARALKIPSRIVVGYQGGDYNSVGNFWKVSQSDAHAWVEVVDDHQQWSLVDPTSTVAPSRLQRGASYATNLGKRLFSGDHFDILALFFGSISNFFENLNFRWNIFLIEFDSEYRETFIQYLKLFFEETLLPLGIVVIGAWWLLKRIRRRITRGVKPYQKIFLDLEKWAHKKGLSRKISEPPVAYCHRLAAQFPPIDKELNELADIYAKASYDEIRDSRQLQKMRRCLRKIKSF